MTTDSHVVIHAVCYILGFLTANVFSILMVYALTATAFSYQLYL